MTSLRRHAGRFLRDERGATSIEYCMIAVFISIVCVSLWTAIGGQVSDMTALVMPGLAR